MKTKGLISALGLILVTCALNAHYVPGIHSIEDESMYLRTQADSDASWCCDYLLDGRWFLAGTGTLGWHGDTEFSNVNAEHGVGGGGSVSAGYIYHCWRFELEGLYRRYETDGVKIGTVSNNNGNIRHTAVMMNFYWDFPITFPFSWFVGGGLGFDRVSFSYRDPGLVSATNNGDVTGADTEFAWQVRTGFEYMYNDFWSLILGYRFFSATKPSFNGHKVDSMPYSNNIDLGVRIAF